MHSLLEKPSLVALLVLLSGAFQTLTIAPFDLWWLGPLTILLLLFSTGALDPKQPGRPILYGWLFGLGLFGSGASWVYVSIHTYGYASPPLAASLTVLFVMGLALFHAFQFWLYYKIRTPGVMVNALIFGALWVLSDAFRSDFLTGFPWLFLGYGHLESPLAGWIPVLGVYGLTAIVVATGLALSLWLLQSQTLATRIVLLAVAAFWICGMMLKQVQWTQDTGEELDVAMLQLNIPQELKWLPSQRRKTLRLLENLTVEHWDHDVIIWPETAVPMLYDQALPLLKGIDQQAIREDVNIISGIPYRKLDEKKRQLALHNSIFSFGQGEGINHKQKLVPFGEYVPLEKYLRGLIAFFDLPMSDFKKGPAEQDLLKSRNHHVAPFICYEVVYPDFVARRAEHADYLLTISNDSWFGTSIGPLQHLQMAQFRAAENGRYMVRATNNGVTAMIDEQGRITARSEQFVQTVLSAKLKIFSGQTPFSSVKSVPLLILCSGIVFFFVLIRKRKTGKDQADTSRSV